VSLCVFSRRFNHDEYLDEIIDNESIYSRTHRLLATTISHLLSCGMKAKKMVSKRRRIVGNHETTAKAMGNRL
jgi:hypothetical protein